MAKISDEALSHFMPGGVNPSRDNSKVPLGDLYLSKIENVKNDPEDFMRVVNEVLNRLS